MTDLKAQGVYTNAEIIRRLIDETDHLLGVTDYMVEINYTAPNDCEPPCISLSIYEHGKQPAIISFVVDQNTTLGYFNEYMDDLHRAVVLCGYAIRNHITYKEECLKVEENERKLREKQANSTEPLPF